MSAMTTVHVGFENEGEYVEVGAIDMPREKARQILSPTSQDLETQDYENTVLHPQGNIRMDVAIQKRHGAFSIKTDKETNCFGFLFRHKGVESWIVEQMNEQFTTLGLNDFVASAQKLDGVNYLCVKHKDTTISLGKDSTCVLDTENFQLRLSWY